MSSASPFSPLPRELPCVLIVDDDRRVVELLDFALTSQGFRTLTASDGDEALQRVREGRPDLVVLDVRLPKRSGLDVCDAMRRTPEHSAVPIIVVSAASETEARLQALARGADDYLAKPFSPKELVARIQRLLARSAEGRAARDRNAQLERDLARALDERKRALDRAGREQELREIALELGPEMRRTLDAEGVARRLLDATLRRLRAPGAALFVAGRSGRFEPFAARGTSARIETLSLASDGELAAYLAALARPVERAELERVHELELELRALAPSAAAVLVPLPDDSGAPALLVLAERPDGRLAAAERESLAALARIGAEAFATALRLERLERDVVDVLALRAESERDEAERLAADEAALRALRAGLECGLDGRTLERLDRAVRLGAWLDAPEGLLALDRFRVAAPSGLLARLAALCTAAADLAHCADDPFTCRAATLVALGRAYAAARSSGAGRETALVRALASAAAGEPTALRRFAEAGTPSADEGRAA